jgi:hypothetical protein
MLQAVTVMAIRLQACHTSYLLKVEYGMACSAVDAIEPHKLEQLVFVVLQC